MSSYAFLILVLLFLFLMSPPGPPTLFLPFSFFLSLLECLGIALIQGHHHDQSWRFHHAKIKQALYLTSSVEQETILIVEKKREYLSTRLM